MAEGQPLALEVDSLTKHFQVFERGVLLKRQIGIVHAVDNVSLKIRNGETFGLVGESGCGKTTIARCIVNLETPTKGKIQFNGIDVTKVFKTGKSRSILALHRGMQYIFQNPYASLDPRMTVADIIMEPF